jgi:ABC-type sugar transport system ATPase subunit
MGHKVAVFDQGRMVQVGTPRAIYDRPANRFVATFIGSPPINILRCRIEPEGEGASAHPIAVEGLVKWSVARMFLPADWNGTACHMDLGLRPETLAVRDSSGLAPSSLALPAQIRKVEFNGPETIATLAMGTQQIVARLSLAKTLGVNDRLWISADLDHILWFDPATGAARALKSR